MSNDFNKKMVEAAGVEPVKVTMTTSDESRITVI
jgi:hypothetical protein